MKRISVIALLLVFSFIGGMLATASGVVTIMKPVFAAAITVTKIKIQRDFSKLRSTVDLTGFTEADLGNMELTIGLRNTVNGESAETTVNVGTGELVDEIPPDPPPGSGV